MILFLAIAASRFLQRIDRYFENFFHHPLTYFLVKIVLTLHQFHNLETWSEFNL